MRFVIILSMGLLFCISAISQPISNEYLDSLRYSHDLNLPNWGPYTKNYIGISHVPDVKKGLRFDLSVFPGYYRRKVEVPSVLFESGYHPWEASPNLEYFSFRHELEWKDQVYVDISYSLINKKSRLIRAEFVNNTELPQSLVLHYMASVHFPPLREYNPDNPLNPAVVDLPGGAKWIDALDYSDLGFARKRPTDNLVTDGKMRGEIRDNGFVNGSAIGRGFGNDNGDWVKYSVSVDHNLSDGVLWLRYKMDNGEQLSLHFSGMTEKEVALAGDGKIETIEIPVGKLDKGTYSLKIISNGGASIDLDGFSVMERKDISGIKVSLVKWNDVPELINGPVSNSLILKYEQFDNYYGIYWDFPSTEIRQWFYKELGDEFRHQVNNHVEKEFHDGSTRGHFTNVFFRPVNCSPKSRKVVYGVVCTGTKAEVEAELEKAGKNSDGEKYYREARSFLPQYQVNPDGETYLFSQKRMATTLATNVVYPVYTQRQYIRHRAPGRWWDCLYTWDSGFIGIGLSSEDIRSAVENLNAYLNETDEQSAFIHHGTPLPVQHYLFLELWNKTQSKALLDYFYPRLKRYYQFLAGAESSTTAQFKSGILSTWDYFYNSGGWDDYPPQKYVHDKKLEQFVTPVATTSHVIRVAKILRMAADELGLKDDVNLYEKDIARLSAALQKYSWDDQSGYYDYVVHDQEKQPVGKLLYHDQVNYNMGLGGLSPLIAGIADKQQTKKMLAHLENPREIWSDIGLSAVDQSAPYYSNSGYWNGTVWMPHQWFFWKTMFDLGEGNFACKIAKTGLDLWKQEVEASYNCMEHFVIETGRGAGWHEFGGLSSPVVAWFNAYFIPGNITTGYNIWIKAKQFSGDNSSLSARFKLFNDQSDSCSVLVCMNPEFQYQVIWNGRVIPAGEIYKGCLLLNLSTRWKEGQLDIKKVNQ